MKKKALEGLALVVLLMATGCAGGDQEEAATPQQETTTTTTEELDPEEGGDLADELADAPENGGPGTYAFEYMGAQVRLEVPTDPTDPRLAELEAYRTKLGAPEVSYVIAEVDNTDGADSINMNQVVVVTEEGEQVTLDTIFTVIGEWQDLVPIDDDSGTYNQGVELYNSYLDNNLLPGAKGTAVVAGGDGDIDSVARVFAYPAGGFDRIEATRVE